MVVLQRLGHSTCFTFARLGLQSPRHETVTVCLQGTEREEYGRFFGPWLSCSRVKYLCLRWSPGLAYLRRCSRKSISSFFSFLLCENKKERERE